MKFLILGLGKTGFSVLKYLQAQGHTCVIFDTRLQPLMQKEVQQDFPSISVFLGKFPVAAWEGIDRLVMSPGLDPTLPPVSEIYQAAKDRGIQVTSDIELFLDEVHQTPAKVIGITGSNGKSTVSALVFEMLKAVGKTVRLGGNFGTPALDLLDPSAEFYILELSSFQLELLSKPPCLHAAVILNISPNHLDRHQTLEHYERIKKKIYEGAQFKIVRLKDGWGRVSQGVGSDHLSPYEGGSGGEIVLTNQNSEELFCRDQFLLKTSELKLLGQHNVENVLAALAIVFTVRLHSDRGGQSARDKAWGPLIEVLRTFSGLPHRCRFVAKIKDVTWINDSKSTTSASTQAALESFGPSVLEKKGKIVLIAGGQAKGGTFEGLLESVSKYVKALILFGQDAEQIEKDLSTVVAVHRVENLKSAVATAKQLSLPGDWILLSPACASLDMFKNYEERGKAFEAEI